MCLHRRSSASQECSNLNKYVLRDVIFLFKTGDYIVVREWSTFIVDMGYRYLKSIHNKIQIQLLKTLRNFFADSDCLSLGAWSEVMVESGLFQSILDSDDESSLYFLNKDNELLSIRFPAILDLNGKYSRVSSYFSFRDQENVSFILFLIIALD